MSTKYQTMTQATLAGVIQELLRTMDLTHYVDVQIFHDSSKPKIIVRVNGNFRSVVEDALEEAWENSNYARP